MGYGMTVTLPNPAKRLNVLRSMTRNRYNALHFIHHLTRTLSSAMRFLPCMHDKYVRTVYMQGPNFIWHVDSYDKLKPFGFPINGCIDGYVCL